MGEGKVRDYGLSHKGAVRRALEAGKPVPKEVISEVSKEKYGPGMD